MDLPSKTMYLPTFPLASPDRGGGGGGNLIISAFKFFYHSSPLGIWIQPFQGELSLTVTVAAPIHVSFLRGLFFYPEDGGSSFLLNVDPL
jgi:hypothetical protein